MNNWRRPDRDHPADYSNMDGGLMAALAAGDRRTLERLSDEFFDFNKPHGHGKTALHWAVENNDVRAIKLLVAFGASPDVADDFRRTPLSLAARDKHEDCALALVELGCDVSISDSFGDTPLHYAVSGGLEKLTKALLSTKRAPVDVYNEAKILPIHKAAERDNLIILKALLDAGANPNLKDHAERTSLHLAAGHGNGEAMVLMLQYGGKLDSHDVMGRTPVSQARENGHLRDIAPVFSYQHSRKLKQNYRRLHPRRPAP